MVTSLQTLDSNSAVMSRNQSANQQDDTRADIRAHGFGETAKCLFDIRVFHPNTQSYLNASIPSVYRHHEQQKKRDYSDRVHEVELASFTPLVFQQLVGKQ